MKMVIDIPEKTNAHIRSNYGHGMKCLLDEDREILCDAIYHGTPRGMTISDLLDKKGISSHDNVLKCDLIAFDAKDGKILFDTGKNKKEYIEQFKTGKVISLWADVRKRNGKSWNCWYSPLIKCYVSHDSWKEGDEE